MSLENCSQLVRDKHSEIKNDPSTNMINQKLRLLFSTCVSNYNTGYDYSIRYAISNIPKFTI